MSQYIDMEKYGVAFSDLDPESKDKCIQYLLDTIIDQKKEITNFEKRIANLEGVDWEL